MTVYLVNIALIVVWGFFLVHINPTKQKKKVYCTIVAVQWILLSGLRDYSVGPDTREYKRHFEETLTVSWKTALKTCWDYLFNDLSVKDPGYRVFVKIFQLYSEDYRVFLFFVAIVFTGLMARWIYKYSSLPDISFLVYSVLFYSFFSVTGIRQTIATALIVFLGYELAKKRKWVQLAIITFVSFMIHKSSVVFILYFIVANMNLTFWYVGAFIAATLLVTILGNRLYAPLAIALGFDETAVNEQTGGAELYATVLLFLCVLTCAMYPWFKKNRTDVKNIFNMVFLTIGSTVLVYQKQGFMRIQQYFSLIILVTIPEIIENIDRSYRVFAYLAVVTILVAYLIYNEPRYVFYFLT